MPGVSAFAIAPALPCARYVPCTSRADTLPAMEAAPSDVQLVVRCANGDEGALAELYDLFGRAAYALALRIVRDASQAEDVVQEAFLDLWRGAARFELRPLLFGDRAHLGVGRRIRDQARQPVELALRVAIGFHRLDHWGKLGELARQLYIGLRRQRRHEVAFKPGMAGDEGREFLVGQHF